MRIIIRWGYFSVYIHGKWFCLVFVYWVFLATPGSLQDLNFLIRDQTRPLAMTAQSPGSQAIPWQVILQVTVSAKWGSVCLFGTQAVNTADILMACASPFSFMRSPLGWRLSRPGQQTQLLKPVGWLVADMAILTAADFQIFTSILPQPAPSRGKTLSWCCRRPGKNLIHDFYPMFSRMSWVLSTDTCSRVFSLHYVCSWKMSFCLPSWPRMFILCSD